MGKNFARFRNRIMAHALVSSILIGVGTALMAFAVLMTSFKLTGKTLSPFYYVIFGASAVLVSVILYFIFKPSDERIAKRLDTFYSLDEKISTMLALREETEGLAVLQREDAEARLGEKSIKALKSKKIIAGLLVFAIAIGSTVGAFVIPAKADGTEAPISEFDKEWIITTLSELITMVEDSLAEENLKSKVLTELRSLLAFVEGSELLSEMKAEAIKAVIAINEALSDANSAKAISEQLVKSQDKNIASLGKELGDLAASGSKKALEALGAAISSASVDDATFVADEMNVHLQNSKVRTDDALNLLLKTLISSVKSKPSGAKDEFKSAGSTLSNLIIIQSLNRSTMSEVINRLCNLFGITKNDITTVAPDTDIDISGPSDSDNTPDDSEVEDLDGPIGSGGLGTGEVVYGSNDIIYDPRTNTYRPYGEIINEYFAKVNEYITDGKTSDEISDAVEEYFGALFDGTNSNN